MSISPDPDIRKQANEAGVFSLTADALGLVTRMEPSDGTLSKEVFRLEVIPGIGQQCVVLYLAGTASQHRPGDTMFALWAEEPTPVAMVRFQHAESVHTLTQSVGLRERVTVALDKAINQELDRARKVIDRLTGRG
jgi:hypothetical protein